MCLKNYILDYTDNKKNGRNGDKENGRTMISKLILLSFALCPLLLAQSGVEIIAQVNRRRR